MNQQGNAKVEYRKATLKNLATQLTLEFGKGFDGSKPASIKIPFFSQPLLYKWGLQ